VTFVNLVTPKAEAKHELLFNKVLILAGKSEAGLLNKSSCLAPAIGVTKFIIIKDMSLFSLCSAA
jgi:hypothetical protein